MACNTLTGIPKSCDGNLGGIVKFYIGNSDQITSYGTASNDLITAITSSADFVEFQFNPNTSNFTEATTIDLATGSTFYLSTITLQLSRREASKRQSLLLIAQGQPELSIMVKDSNGLYWMFGLDDDKMYLSGDEGGTGTAKADLNGYILTFTGETATPAYEVEESVALALVTA